MIAPLFPDPDLDDFKAQIVKVHLANGLDASEAHMTADLMAEAVVQGLRKCDEVCARGSSMGMRLGAMQMALQLMASTASRYARCLQDMADGSGVPTVAMRGSIKERTRAS